MDQDARTAGPELEVQQGEPRSPEAIRADIAQTRQEVGDTVEALAAKTDVKARAHEKVDEIRATVRSKTQSSTPEGAQKGGRQVVDTVRANPAPFALAGAALFGFLVARLTGRR